MKTIGINIGNDNQATMEAQQTLEKLAEGNAILAGAMAVLAEANRDIAKGVAKLNTGPSNITISGVSINMTSPPTDPEEPEEPEFDSEEPEDEDEFEAEEKPEDGDNQ